MVLMEADTLSSDGDGDGSDDTDGARTKAGLPKCVATPAASRLCSRLLTLSLSTHTPETPRLCSKNAVLDTMPPGNASLVASPNSIANKASPQRKKRRRDVEAEGEEEAEGRPTKTRNTRTTLRPQGPGNPVRKSPRGAKRRRDRDTAHRLETHQVVPRRRPRPVLKFTATAACVRPKRTGEPADDIQTNNEYLEVLGFSESRQNMACWRRTG